MDYASPLITGIIVSLASWLPLVPDGSAISRVLGSMVPAYADYLVPAYLGITFAVLFHFQHRIASDVQGVVRGRVSPDIRYFFYASLFTILVGYPILGNMRGTFGPDNSALVNAIVGIALVFVGLICGGRTKSPLEKVDVMMRDREDDVTLLDSIVSGVLQGVSFLGSVSRSGLVLLGLSITGMDVRRALELSFLIAPTYLVMKLLFMGEWEPGLPVGLLFTAFLAAFTMSLITMALLLRLSEALGRRLFLVIYGLVAIAIYLLGVVL